MGKNILIIDDEELIIRSLSRLLEKQGFTVLVAKKGEDALAMAEEEDFDLIIADIRMPGMDGVETIQHIHDNLRKNKSKKIPTIFITGYANKELEQKAMTLKPIAYIYKPFDIPELICQVKKALE